MKIFKGIETKKKTVERPAFFMYINNNGIEKYKIIGR